MMHGAPDTVNRESLIIPIEKVKIVERMPSLGPNLHSEDATSRARSQAIDKELKQQAEDRKRQETVLVTGSRNDVFALRLHLKYNQGQGYGPGELMQCVSDLRWKLIRTLQNIILSMPNREVSIRSQIAQDLWGRVLNLEPCRVDQNFTEHDLGTLVTVAQDHAVLDEMKSRRAEDRDDLAHTQYFLDAAARIASIGYVPTKEDLLRGLTYPGHTTGIHGMAFEGKHLMVNVLDIRTCGGTRSKLNPYLQDVTSVLFCVDFKTYKEPHHFNPAENGLTHAMFSFASFVHSKWYEQSSLILFLLCPPNLQDLLDRHPMTNYFEAYTGVNDVPSTTAWIAEQFRRHDVTGQRVHPMVTTVDNPRNFTFIESVLQNTLRP